MNKYITFIILLGVCMFSNAQNANNNEKSILSEGAKLLFKDTKSKLTNAEKNLLFIKLQMKLSADKKEFFIDEYPISVKVFPTDMNKDGREELFIMQESTALFGNTGHTTSLFMKKNVGVYEQQSEITGGLPLVLPTKNLNYPDLLVGGPGMEFPVYRWDGKKYMYNRKIKDAALSKIKYTGLEEYSKMYVDAIK